MGWSHATHDIVDMIWSQSDFQLGLLATFLLWEHMRRRISKKNSMGFFNRYKRWHLPWMISISISLIKQNPTTGSILRHSIPRHRYLKCPIISHHVIKSSQPSNLFFTNWYGRPLPCWNQTNTCIIYVGLIKLLLDYLLPFPIHDSNPPLPWEPHSTKALAQRNYWGHHFKSRSKQTKRWGSAQLPRSVPLSYIILK